MTKKSASTNSPDSKNQKNKQFEYMDASTIEEYEESFCCDSDEYERLCAERRKEFEQYLSEFETDLIAAGLKDATIDRHYRNVDFYLNSYLLRAAPLDVRAGCYKVGDFLGSFFIHRCMWSTPETIKSNCASFKKFYKSMLERGHVSQDDYDCLCFTIKEDKPYWCDLCAEFNDPYTENPFSPFSSSELGFFGSVGSSPSGGGPLGSLGSSPFDGGAIGGGAIGGGPLDDPDLSPADREAIMATAQEIIDMLSAQGMTQDEMLDAIEDAMQSLDFEADMYDKPDDELLDIIRQLGVASNRSELEELMRKSVSEPEAADKVCDAAKLDLDEEDYDTLVLALEILWERWLPEEPSDTILLSNIMSGYLLIDDNDESEALEAWGLAWDALKRIARLGERELLVSDEPVVDEHSIPAWITDYDRLLEQEAKRDPALAIAHETFTAERKALSV